MTIWRICTTATAALAAIAAVGACTPVDPPPTTIAVDFECRVDRDTLETAIEAWWADPGAGAYPDSLDQAAFYLEPDFPLDEWTYARVGTGYTLAGPC
ncbi:MAG: hypothetical protein M9922_11740 [Microthrixaceae bacterium]|nr:hypothetical protein [Microthrixaceae bacterium]